MFAFLLTLKGELTVKHIQVIDTANDTFIYLVTDDKTSYSLAKLISEKEKDNLVLVTTIAGMKIETIDHIFLNGKEDLNYFDVTKKISKD